MMAFFVAYCAGSFVDLWVTDILLRMGHVESNPIAAWVIRDYGLWVGAGILKAVGALIVLFALRMQEKRHPRLTVFTAGMLALLQWLVVIWNFLQLV